MKYTLWDQEFVLQMNRFQVLTKPVIHALCGELQYELYFMGELSTMDSEFMRFDPETRTLYTYGADLKFFQIMGNQPIALRGFIPDYPQLTATEEDTFLIRNPCIITIRFDMPQVMVSKNDYYYYAED